MIEQNEQSRTNNLKWLRDKLGMSQQQLATELGIAASTLSRCERGLTELELKCAQWKKLVSLCLQVGIPLDQIPDQLSGFGGGDSM